MWGPNPPFAETKTTVVVVLRSFDTRGMSARQSKGTDSRPLTYDSTWAVTLDDARHT